MWLVLTLLLPLAVCLGSRVEPGCEDWTVGSRTEVCCKRCKPGNSLVKQCDVNATTLCTPCENGTYTDTTTAKFCKSCTQCISPLRVKRFCTAASDTVCECVEGFLCGDAICSYCIRQCGKGEEPTKDRDCRRCPEGTFNSQIHQRCETWSSSCPSPDQQIVVNGTAVSDIICADAKPTATTKLPPKTNSTDSYVGTMLVMAMICGCLIIGSAIPLLVTLHLKKEKTVKIPPRPVENIPGRNLMPEPEQCSFCFAQEEQGSNSSLLSDDKPFELVV